MKETALTETKRKKQKNRNVLEIIIPEEPQET